MSRIGKKAVPVPSGVTANIDGQTVKVKGPKGALQLVLPDDVVVKMEEGTVKVDPRNETKRARSMWGTSRTLVSNMFTGVSKGFEQKLEIVGVGFGVAIAIPSGIGYRTSWLKPRAICRFLPCTAAR